MRFGIDVGVLVTTGHLDHLPYPGPIVTSYDQAVSFCSSYLPFPDHDEKMIMTLDSIRVLDWARGALRLKDCEPNRIG